MKPHHIKIEACDCPSCKKQLDDAFWAIIDADYTGDEIVALDGISREWKIRHGSC